MRCGITVSTRSVARRSDDFAIGVHDNSANGYFTTLGRSTRLCECCLHMGIELHTKILGRKLSPFASPAKEVNR